MSKDSKNILMEELLGIVERQYSYEIWIWCLWTKKDGFHHFDDMSLKVLRNETMANPVYRKSY